VHQGQEDSRSGFLILRLHNQVFRSRAGKLNAHRLMAQVLFTYHGKYLPKWNKLFSALESMFEHRSAPNKVDVLFRQIATAGHSNIALQSLTIATGQH
jgi:hypothetical protein